MGTYEHAFDQSASAPKGSHLEVLAAELAERRLPPPEERKRIREAAKIPKARAARALGVSQHCFAGWERDLIQPRPDHAVAYRRFLELLAQG